MNGLVALKCTALISSSIRAVRRAISSFGGKALGIISGFLSLLSSWSEFLRGRCRVAVPGARGGGIWRNVKVQCETDQHSAKPGSNTVTGPAPVSILAGQGTGAPLVSVSRVSLGGSR